MDEIDKLIAEQTADLKRYNELVTEMTRLDERILRRKPRLLALLIENVISNYPRKIGK